MGETVLLALLIIAAVWAMALAMVVSLCVFAKRGDAALEPAPAVGVRRLRGTSHSRGAHACDVPADAVRH
jgi:hypothetical protein